ncbi:ATP-binding cassette sub-family C member 12-like [Centroberyx gerrardi]
MAALRTGTKLVCHTPWLTVSDVQIDLKKKKTSSHHHPSTLINKLQRELRERRTEDGARWKSDSTAFSPEGLSDLDYREKDPPPSYSKYHRSLKTLRLFRCSSQSNPLDNAGFLSFTTFAWMTPLMWAMFRNKMNISSLSLSPLDGASINGERLQRLWEEEVAKVGLEKASLIRVILRFQRTRLLLSVFVGVLFMLAVFVGPMINVLTNDGHRMFEAVVFGSFLLSIPVLLIVCIVYACYILGYTALTGVFIYLVFIPIQFAMAKLINMFRWKAMVTTDSRVRTMNEILTCIKLIKMYAWEESFEKKIADIRKNEKNVLEKAGYVQNVNSTITGIIPTIATILTFVVHTLLRLPLSSSDAFTTISIFNSMRFCLGVLPLCVRALAEAAVSVGRLKKIMLVQNPEPYLIQKNNSGSAIVMDNATLSWTKTTDQPAPPPDTANGLRGDKAEPVYQDVKTEALPTLRNISFTLPKGNLLGVCGNVGSGKTSLISSILEQMHLQQGSITADGTFAYVSQQAWIFHGTVQDNILMGEPFDQTK